MTNMTCICGLHSVFIGQCWSGYPGALVKQSVLSKTGGYMRSKYKEPHMAYSDEAM